MACETKTSPHTPYINSAHIQGRENEFEVGGQNMCFYTMQKNARILFYCLYLNNIILNVKTILFYILDLQTLF